MGKNLNFGVRGWLLLIYQALAFVTFTVFSNWPMNILGDMYGGAQKLSTIYTVCTLLGIVVQLIISAFFIRKIKNMKLFSSVLGVICIVLALGIMVIPPSMLTFYQIVYGAVVFFTIMWSTFSIGILVGQWFPRKKGAFMGIATLAFPITNGVIGTFANRVFKFGAPDVFGAFLPYFILTVIAVLIGIIFIKSYPEQCGGYRDNDKSITPEAANAMMEAEIEGKRTSVWKIGRVLTLRDFWLAVIPMGSMLLCAVGFATQTNAILGSAGAELDKFGGFSGVMLMFCIFGIIGSYVLGIVDARIGTKKAVLISVILMVLSGIIGIIPNTFCLVLSVIVLALFQGSSSNFTVSFTAQYWRREDFQSVFSCVNPIANVIQAMGPMMIAALFFGKGVTAVYTAILIFGVISLICILLFSAKHVKTVDDRLRKAAGKPLDNELADRK